MKKLSRLFQCGAKSFAVSFPVVLAVSFMCLGANSAHATLADLLPQNISVIPDPATVGGTVTVSYKVTNQGGTAAPASHTKVQIENPAIVSSRSRPSPPVRSGPTPT